MIKIYNAHFFSCVFSWLIIQGQQDTFITCMKEFNTLQIYMKCTISTFILSSLTILLIVFISKTKQKWMYSRFLIYFRVKLSCILILRELDILFNIWGCNFRKIRLQMLISQIKNRVLGLIRLYALANFRALTKAAKI